MATATQQQARDNHARQAALAAAGGLAARRQLVAGAAWADILTSVAAFQLRAAALAVSTAAARLDAQPVVAPTVFAGVSSLGYPISEPVVSTIDARVPAPPEALPQQWWAGGAALFATAIEQLVASEIQDTGRSAAQAEMFAQGAQRYVRVLVPPSCKRCAVLAGRIYRTDKAFDRHPRCDCVNEPVASLDDALDRGLVVTPDEAYRRGWIRDLTAGERKALDDGADITQVINSGSGISTANFAGRTVKTTRYGTTRRAAWRQQNPSARIRLRPEAIYDIADGDRDTALRLLKANGYLT